MWMVCCHSTWHKCILLLLGCWHVNGVLSQHTCALALSYSTHISHTLWCVNTELLRVSSSSWHTCILELLRTCVGPHHSLVTARAHTYAQTHAYTRLALRACTSCVAGRRRSAGGWASVCFLILSIYLF